MSVLKLPEPSGWRGGRAVFAWALLGGLAIVALILYWGAAALIRGHYLTTVVALGWALFPAAILAAIARASFGRVSVRAHYDSTGTTLLPDRWLSILFITGLVVLIPSGVLFVILAPSGTLDIPMSRGMQIFAPVLMAAAVLVAVLGLISAWRRGGIGYLKVTPAGVETANIVSTKSVGWDEIVDVKDSSEEKKTRRAIVLCLRDGSEAFVESANLYVPGGVALYWMVRHYWRNGADRSELADRRSLDRLRDEQFVAD
jgi:hypothetical protein